jgi:hypothetical protein
MSAEKRQAAPATVDAAAVRADADELFSRVQQLKEHL